MEIGKYLILILARNHRTGKINLGAFVSPFGMNDEEQVKEFAVEAAAEYVEELPGSVLELVRTLKISDAQL